MRRLAVYVVLLAVAGPVRLAAWGERGHRTITQAAVRALPDDGPTFLPGPEAGAVYPAPTPDRMVGPEVATVIASNRMLADQLQISGTPTFVFEDNMVRGYVPLEQMQAMVAQLRNE